MFVTTRFRHFVTTAKQTETECASCSVHVVCPNGVYMQGARLGVCTLWFMSHLPHSVPLSPNSSPLADPASPWWSLLIPMQPCSLQQPSAALDGPGDKAQNLGNTPKTCLIQSSWLLPLFPLSCSSSINSSLPLFSLNPRFYRNFFHLVQTQ